MRYRRPARKLIDRNGRLAHWLVHNASRRSEPLLPGELGRIGGEMARRMVEAALAYLTERSVREMRVSFTKAAFGHPKNEGVTPARPKA